LRATKRSPGSACSARPALPAEIIAKINGEVRNTFADPGVRKDFLDRQYFDSIAGTPDELASSIKSDEPKWRKVIRDAKVKGE